MSHTDARYSFEEIAPGVDTFPDPVGHFEAPWRPFWILQVVGIAGGERVPPLLSDWYFVCFQLTHTEALRSDMTHLRVEFLSATAKRS